MKVRLLVPRAGNGFAQNVGEEIDVPANEAAAMEAAGQCVILRGVAPEKAVRTARPMRAAD